MSAAREYKDVIAELTAAAGELHERDRMRAAQLARELSEIDAALVRAERQAVLVRIAAELRWEAAVEALWGESWMTLRAHPQPAPDVDPEQLDALEAAAERATAALLEAVRRRFGLGLR